MGIGFNPVTGEMVTQANIPRTIGKIVDVPTGFENHTDTTLTASGFSAGAGGTITLGDAGSGFRLWSRGRKKNYSGDETFTIPAATGLYFLYYTGDGNWTKTVTTTPWDIEDAHALVAGVYYNDTTGDRFVAEERHQTQRNSLEWHDWAHNCIGALYRSGFGISGYVLKSDALADVQIAIAEGSFNDEDIELTVAAKLEGDDWDKWYREGATGPWRKTASTDTIPAFHSANVPKINQDTGGGTWALVSVTANYYFNVFIFGTNSIESANRHVLIPGQNEYGSQAEAQENEGLNSLDLGNFLGPEIVNIYKLTLQYKTSYTNNNARIEIVALEDLRGTSSIGVATVPTSHASLGDRSLPNQHPDSAISTSSTTLTGQLDNTTEIDLQDVLQRIDDFGYIPNWVTGSAYRVGNVVVIDHKIFQCTSDHTANASFDVDNDTNGYWKYVASGGLANKVQTTDATTTTISSTTVPSNVACSLIIRISAFEPATGDSRAWALEYSLENNGGTVTTVKMRETGNYDAGASAWTALADVSGTTFRIRVTGEAGKTINWNSTCEHTYY